MTAQSLRIAFRYVSGRRLDGKPREAGRTTRWSAMPAYQRAAVRLLAPPGAAAAVAAYAAQPVLTGGAVTALAAVGTVRGVRALRRRWQLRRFTATYVRPTLAALGPALGDVPVRLHVSPELGNLVPRLAQDMSKAEIAARAWYGEHVEPLVRLLPDQVWRTWVRTQEWAKPATSKLEVFRRPVPADQGPRIELTAATPFLTAEQRQFVSAVIAAKVPAGELVEQWDQVGEQVRVVWTVRRRPPSRVGYADLDARMSMLKEWEFFLGLGVGGKPLVVSLKDDSPHIAVSASTGAGKTELAKLIAVQVLCRGGRVVILDRKGSHSWAIGLPGVLYCRTPAQMHDELIKLGVLAEHRNDLAFGNPDADLGKRVLVIAEELNATFDLLRDYWDEIREKDEPKKSPGVRALKDILFMGRSALINVIGIAQMLTARAIGGPEARECFAIRCLARYTTNAWKMLVPEAGMPRSSRTLGRWQVVIGGQATEVQVCYLPDAQARLLVHKLSPGAQTPLMADDQEMSPGHGPVGDAVADPLSELVTLRVAVERGIAPWSFDATKKRLQRGRAADPPRGPVPVGKYGLADTYRVGDLIVWIESELVP